MYVTMRLAENVFLGYGEMKWIVDINLSLIDFTTLVETKVSIKCRKLYRQRQIRQRMACAIPQKHIVSFEDLSVLKFNGRQMYGTIE